jgi:hypothetical protein
MTDGRSTHSLIDARCVRIGNLITGITLCADLNSFLSLGIQNTYTIITRHYQSDLRNLNC